MAPILKNFLAAAHAGCFTMEISAKITAKGFVPKSLDTEALVNFWKIPKITGIHLIISGSVEGMIKEDLEAIVKDAEQNCIISKALSISITSEARFTI